MTKFEIGDKQVAIAAGQFDDEDTLGASRAGIVFAPREALSKCEQKGSLSDGAVLFVFKDLAALDNFFDRLHKVKPELKQLMQANEEPGGMWAQPIKEGDIIEVNEPVFDTTTGQARDSWTRCEVLMVERNMIGVWNPLRQQKLMLARGQHHNWRHA